MKALQKRIKKYCKENNRESPPEHRLLDIMSELGEVSKEVLEMSNYGRESFEYNENIKLELGDLFYSLITFANSLDLDLEECLNLSLEKYNERPGMGSSGFDKNI